MLAFKRVHTTGTQTVVREWADGWHIHIDLREVNHAMTIEGFLCPTAERAQELADREVLNHGHVCSAACQAWKEGEMSQEPRQLILASPDA